MKSTILISLSILLLFGLALSACIPTFGAVPNQPNLGAAQTAAAQTISAQATLIAGQSAVIQLTQMAQLQATATPVVPTATSIPPTVQPQPTATPKPTATPIPTPCDWVGFIGDITAKDGTVFHPGDEFTKTWRVKNIGTCTWTRNYALVFSTGTRMNGDKVIYLAGNVAPGETVDLSVNMQAPDQAGSYTGYWMLRNVDNVLFGLGSNANEAMWIQIKVEKQTETVYNLYEEVCSAAWQSTSGNLPCPTTNQDTQTGYMLQVSKPILETGEKDNDPALVTFPAQGDGGMISGRYPAIKIKSGDHFKTVVGCLSNSPNCNVMFQLNYSVDGGPVQNLGTWTQVSDGNLNKIDIDLSQFNGKSVSFILTVLNNGSNQDDNAFWLKPRIIR